MTEPVETPRASSWWGRLSTRSRILIFAAAGMVVAATVVVLVVVNARPSFESIAEDCGGTRAGIAVDAEGILVDLLGGTDGLMCVAPKVLSNVSDQYLVMMMVDGNAPAQMTIDGRQVTAGKPEARQATP
ncbi:MULTISPECIES: hypothetical protein [unclassified Microbacterium]|uniref:hypothetical protein n=1 Tax=unclassified Microbacterium TaxID=2609290 RepID=UPI003017003C